jgi:hypothetical protein
MTGDKVKSDDEDGFTEPHYVWLFQCSNQTALHATTRDPKAGNRPKDACRDGRWTIGSQLVVGPDTMSNTGINIEALKAGIQREGFYLWNVAIEALSDTLRLMRLSKAMHKNYRVKRALLAIWYGSTPGGMCHP